MTFASVRPLGQSNNNIISHFIFHKSQVQRQINKLVFILFSLIIKFLCNICVRTPFYDDCLMAGENFVYLISSIKHNWYIVFSVSCFQFIRFYKIVSSHFLWRNCKITCFVAYILLLLLIILWIVRCYEGCYSLSRQIVVIAYVCFVNNNKYS